MRTSGLGPLRPKHPPWWFNSQRQSTLHILWCWDWDRAQHTSSLLVGLYQTLEENWTAKGPHSSVGLLCWQCNPNNGPQAVTAVITGSSFQLPHSPSQPHHTLSEVPIGSRSQPLLKGISPSSLGPLFWAVATGGFPPLRDLTSSCMEAVSLIVNVPDTFPLYP